MVSIKSDLSHVELIFTLNNGAKHESIGIPVKSFPEDKIPAVQYAALIADLVMKTKQTLK